MDWKRTESLSSRSSMEVDMATRITSPGRYLIAGLGALMPIAANLLVVDFENILIQFSLPVVVGYMAAL